MAVWKKVIVSGSNASLNQVTASIFSGSQFSGSFFGNGSGLTGVTATAAFPSTAKTDLVTTDKFFINDDAGNATSGNKQVTYANLVLDLAGSGAGTSNLTTTDTGDSLALTSQVSITGITASILATNGVVSSSVLSAGASQGQVTNTVNGAATTITVTQLGTTGNPQFNNVTASVVSASNGFTGSLSASFLQGLINNTQLRNSSVTVGSTNIALGATATTITGLVSLNSTSVTASVVSASQFTGSLFGTASWAQNAVNVAYSGLTGVPSGIVSASSLDSPAQGEVRLTTNGVAGSTIDLGLQTTDSPTFAGATISTNALQVNNTNGITTNAATFPIAPSATTINIGTTSNTAINIGTTATTVTIPGNLNVQGATTIISSSNLTVSDKFVFISSGSTSATNEGGIIVSNASNSSGSAFFYEGPNTRWALAPAVGATDTGATPNSFIVSVSGSATDPSGNPTYGGSATGYGNMFINTTTEDIWIFV